MNARQFAIVSGTLYIALGIASLIPALSSVPTDLPQLHLDVSYGLFLGVFPQNIVNKLAILVFGVAGVLAYREGTKSLAQSVLYARAVALVMGGAALLGSIATTATFFGYWPLWGAEAGLHAGNAVIGAYFGFLPAGRGLPVAQRTSRA